MTETVGILVSPMPDEKDTPQPASSGTVRVETDLLEKARYVCFHRREKGKRIPLTQYIDSIIRSVIERDYEEEQAKQEQDAQKKRKRKED